MTVAENRERGHDVEAAACDRWPLERVADDLLLEAEWEYRRELEREAMATIELRARIPHVVRDAIA